MAACFASAYGTFVTVAPAPASPPQQLEDAGIIGGWLGGGGVGLSPPPSFPSSLSSSSSSSMSSSGAASPPLAAPVAYRCLLLSHDGGEISGVRLGFRQGLLLVTEVLSESVQDVCQVRPGDVVTHVNGEAAAGLRSQGGLRRLLLRTRVSPSSSRRRAVVELRLLRARTLPSAAKATASPPPPPPPPPPPQQQQQQLGGGSSSSGDGTDKEDEDEGRCGYAGLHRACPVFLYEVHACDTLGVMAAMFRTTEQEVRRDNRDIFIAGEKQAGVQPGQLLKIRNPDYHHALPSSSLSLLPPMFMVPEEQQRPPGADPRQVVVVVGGGGSGMEERKALTPERRRQPPSAAARAASSSMSSFSLSAAAATTTTTTVLERRYHEVRAGETLEGIARLYGVDDLVEIRRWNRSLFPVGETRPLLPGTKLLIYARVALAPRLAVRCRAVGPSQPISIAYGGNRSSSDNGSSMAWSAAPSPE